MAFTNVGQIADLIEVYAGQAGVSRDKISRRLLWDIINLKANEFARRTGILEKSSTIETVADQAEYELPSGVTYIKYVDFDSYRIKKITHEQVRELQGQTS